MSSFPNTDTRPLLLPDLLHYRFNLVLSQNKQDTNYHLRPNSYQLISFPSIADFQLTRTSCRRMIPRPSPKSSLSYFILHLPSLLLIYYILPSRRRILNYFLHFPLSTPFDRSSHFLCLFYDFFRSLIWDGRMTSRGSPTCEKRWRWLWCCRC